MATAESVKTKLQALIDASNAKTGQNHTTITDAMTHLIDNYNQINFGGDTSTPSDGNDDFVGIKYSDFDSYRGSPRVADARSLPDPGEWNFGGYGYLFASSGPNPNNNWHALLREVYLPKIDRIYANLFYNCTNLTTIHADFTPVGIIDANAFYSCRALSDIPYMPNLTSIATNAFHDCQGLTKIRLYSTPSTIHSSAFKVCTNITDIYVPWAEGAVANAPWGATNATIHYNTVYDDNHNPIE